MTDLISFAEAHSKTFGVAETGAGSTGDGAGVADNAVFVKWLSQTLTNSAVPVAFVNIWDSNAGSNYAFSSAQGGKPNEAAAWKTYFGAGSQSLPDTTAPEVTVGWSLSGFTNMRSITLSGIASDAQSGLSDIEIYDQTSGRQVDLGAATIDTNGHWTFIATNLSDGDHKFILTAKDVAGNMTAPILASTPITVDTVAPQPTIRIITGNRDGGITLAGTSEANSVVAVTTASDGKTVALGSVTTSGNGAWQLTSHTAINTDKINSYTAVATDAAGNVGNATGVMVLASTGADTLTGTPNVTDVFAIMSFRGSDIINGFQTMSAVGAAHDIVNFSGRGITSFIQIKQMMSGTNSTIINIGSGKTITLADVAPSLLSAADFRYS